MNHKPILLELSILTFIVSIFIIFSRVDVPGREIMYGVWKGEYLGKELLFSFNSDGTCVLNFKDKASGKIERLNGKFELGLSKSPIPLTVRSIPQLDHPLHTIVKFNGDDSIRMAHFATRWRLRPISFDRGASMNLMRTRENL